MFTNFRTADELMSQQEPDPLPSWTNEPCPFCGQRIQWDGDQLFCAPCQRTWAGWDDVRFDRHEVKYAARKAAQVAAEEALMWEEYYESEDDQRDEDEDGHGNDGGGRAGTVDAMIITHVSPRPFWLRQCWKCGGKMIKQGGAWYCPRCG